MSIKSIARSIVVTAVLASLHIIPAAAAGVEKMLSDCGAGTCPFDSASISTPAGWMHDDFAERTLHMKVLVRSGQSFASTDAFILATVLPNLGNDSIADLVWRGQTFIRAQTPDVTIRALPDIARASGKVGFLVFQYEKPNAPTRRFERIATTMDTDRQGNVFVVSISLTADSAKVLEAAEAAYLEVLRGY